MVNWTPEAKGVALSLFGCLLGTPDFVFSNLAKRCLNSESTATILFWKNLAMSGFAFIAAFCENKKEILKPTPRLHKFYYFLGTIIARTTVQISLSASFLLTFSANANLLFSTNGLWSALLGWIILKEYMPIQTKCALILATLSIAGMTLPDIFSTSNQTSAKSNLGDALALLAAISLSSFYIIARKAPPDVPIPLAVAIGTLVAAVLTGIYSLGTTGKPSHLFLLATIAKSNAQRARFFILTLTNGALLGLLVIIFAIAPRYITGAKIGLICLSQNITSPLCAFFVLNQVPPLPTLIGGCFLIIVITIHEYWHVSKSSKERCLVSTDTSEPQNDSTVRIIQDYNETAVYQPLSNGHYHDYNDP